MFFELICLFFALMNIVICLPSSNYSFNSDRQSPGMPSIASSLVSTRVFENVLALQHVSDNEVPPQSAHDTPSSHSFESNAPSIRISSSGIFTKIFQNERLLQQLKAEKARGQNERIHRARRGIVLIDEDFNVPPERGVKQGWADGDFDKNVTKSEEKDEVMSTEEGSGQIDETSSPETIHNTTAEQLQISTDKIKVTSTKEYDKTVLTSDNVSSGDVITSSMEYTDKIMPTTEDIEGSGEISEQFTKTSTTTEAPTEQDDKSTIKVCLKRSCNTDDLLLSPGISTKVPEGTNLTLSCSTANASEHELLKLFKYNDSDSSFLQESNKEKLNFDIPLSQRHHSGTYMCLKFTDELCCHQRLDIIIYEVPNYKTHLIIIGLVAAISLFTCILLGIYRSFKIKNYEVQMELQNMEKPVLF